MASQALEKQNAYQEIGALLTRGVGQLAAALPRMGQASAELHLARAQRAVRVALSQLRGNQKLLACTQDSIIGSVVAACQLGLELDGVLGQAYLVPYGKQCQMQIGYRGMVALAMRGGVASVTAEVVYDGDTFEFEYGTDAKLVHRPSCDEVGDPKWVWAMARFPDGTSVFKVMTIAQIDAVRKRAKAEGGPWREHWEEMARKTVVRNLCKYLPQVPDAQRAAIVSEYIETGHAPPQPKLEDFPGAIDVVEDANNG